MNINIRPLCNRSVFSMKGFCIWDPSLLVDASGKYHLFFSRWPISHGFEAWVTHAEVCRASAETTTGPYRFEEVILPKRHGFWDGEVTHNPSARMFGGKYYLYYTGNQGNGEWWNHRNRQRIGLAVAESPTGPWQRFDQPLLDITPGSWDSMVTTNPSCDRTADGRFMLVYKGVGDLLGEPAYGPVGHGVAFADAPEGLFRKCPVPIFSAGSDFSGEDPFVWCQGRMHYALLKDMGSFYSSDSRAIVLFESEDGINWRLACNPTVITRLLEYEDGTKCEVHRLERPYIYLEGGRPSVLLCSVKPNAASDQSEIIAMEIKPL